MKDLAIRKCDFFCLVRFFLFNSFIKHCIIHYLTQRVYYKILHDNKVVGRIRYHKRKEGCYYISYFIEKEHRKKGYGTKSVGLFTQKLFEKFMPVKLFAEVYGSNVYSMKVLQANGFVLEAKLKNYNPPESLLIFSKANPNNNNQM